jgi:uncharacterized hydrophobic protein (TIGR00271 family)
MSKFSESLHGGPMAESEISRVRTTLLFEPPNRRRQLARFWILLTLAAAIATYGLLADSVATVIGAMIVAPLMLPIMGLAFAVSIGDRKAILSSLAVSIGGIATAIAVGYVLSLVVSSAFDPANNAQIMARTSPRLVDLMAAIATGLAGAFATGRQDVSDTLPGVAIAISLVPPLANVGILLSTGHADLAMGSLLLFVTNYFAILLTGALVFGLMGYPQASLVQQSVRARRTAVVIVVVMVILIAIPLGATTYQVYKNASAEGTVASSVATWIEGSGYRYVSASADGATIDVVIVGEGPVPPGKELEDLVADRVFGMKVHVEALPSQTVDFTTQ